MISLFVASWLLSGSWLAGVLATFFFIFNKYGFFIVLTFCFIVHLVFLMSYDNFHGQNRGW